MTPRRILLVSEFYPPEIGGLEGVVKTLAGTLAAHGHTVSVATQSSDGRSSVTVENGVRVHRLVSWARHLSFAFSSSARPFHLSTADLGLVRGLRAVLDAERPEIVHAHNWMLYSCLPVLEQGPPAIVTLHDYGFTCVKKTNQRDGRICNQPSLGRCTRCATEQYGVVKAAVLASGLAWSRRNHRDVARFLAVSSSVAESFTLHGGVDPRLVEVVPSFVPNDVAQTAAITPRPTFLPEADGYLIFVGALGRHKGVDVLLEAHRSMTTRIPLVMIGTTRGESDELLASAGPDAIVVTDRPHAEVMSALRHAAIAVVPSVWEEPFGLVAVEAMLAGTAIVASATGGLRDIVADGLTGVLVPPGDAVALTAALESLLSAPQRLEDMSEAAVVRAGRFTAAQVVPLIESVYEDVLAHS